MATDFDGQGADSEAIRMVSVLLSVAGAFRNVFSKSSLLSNMARSTRYFPDGWAILSDSFRTRRLRISLLVSSCLRSVRNNHTLQALTLTFITKHAKNTLQYHYLLNL